MLYRKCSTGADLQISFAPHFNITTSKQYAVVKDGKVVRKTNSLKVAEETYLKECEKIHKHNEPISGEFKIGKHKLDKGVVKEI